MNKAFLQTMKILLVMLLVSTAYADNAKVDFQAIFTSWANLFNEKKFPEVCGLFSKKITADYLGTPKKNYSLICDGFKAIFQKQDARYHYRFIIKNIYHVTSLAAVRITWFLDIYDKGSKVLSTQDEGLDILEKEHDGQWRIINYMAYPVHQQGKLIG